MTKGSSRVACATTAVLACVLAGACSHADVADQFHPDDSAPAFTVEDTIDPWVAMWNSYDLDQVDALFLLDDRVSYLSSEREGLIKGIEAVREHHRGFDFVAGGREAPSRLWLEDVEAIEIDATVVVTAVWLFDRGEEPDAAPQRGPVTFVYVPDEGGYRIAHVHFANYPDAEDGSG